MDRNLKVKGIVTGTRNFGEIHRSITLLTQESGILNVIIFGGRKGKNSSLAPLFSFGEFMLYHDTVRDEYSLKEEVLNFTAERINTDLKAVYTASYFCEAVNYLKTDEFSESYKLLSQALLILEKSPENSRKILIDFTWKLLILSGVGSDLLNCPCCDKQYEENEELHFSTSLLTPACKDCSDNHEIILTPGARRYLHYTQNMSFSQALQVELYETAQSRISIFLLKWINAFCGRTLFTIQSGLL